MNVYRIFGLELSPYSVKVRSYFRYKLDQLDLYPVMAWLMVTAVIIILANLLADIVYGYLDPRIRYS